MLNIKYLKKFAAFGMCLSMLVTGLPFGSAQLAFAQDEDEIGGTVPELRNFKFYHGYDSIKSGSTDYDNGQLNKNGMILLPGESWIFTTEDYIGDYPGNGIDNDEEQKTYYLGFKVPENSNLYTIEDATEVTITATTQTGDTISETYNGARKLTAKKYPLLIKGTNTTAAEVNSYDGSKVIGCRTVMLEDLTIDALEGSHYNVEWDYDGGYLEEANPNLYYINRDTYDITTNAPIKLGYRFTGWNYSNQLFFGGTEGKVYGIEYTNWDKAKDASTLVNAQANWEKYYITVSYRLQGGFLNGEATEWRFEDNRIYNIESDKGYLDSTPEKSGYKFDGWYIGDTQINSFTDIPKSEWNSDNTYDIVAKWSADSSKNLGFDFDTATKTLTINTQTALKDCKWQPYYEETERIVLANKITKIENSVFKYFSNVNQVAVPNSVTLIDGSDILRCGRSNNSDVTIICNKGSYAESYAKENGYGVSYCEHTETTIKNSKDATYFEKGYSGDTYCKLCGKKVKTGKATAKLVLSKVKINKVSSTKKKQLNISWNKNSNASGYEIQYSTSKSFSAKKTKTVKITGNKNVSTTIKKLSSKKKYYVKIRAYKSGKVNKKSVKVYSKWSSVSSAKVK